MEYNNAHTIEGLGWLLVQSRGQARIEELLSAYLDRVQNIEDALQAWQLQNGITTATGEGLDRLGAIVGLSRGSMTDDAYRPRIILQTFINRSNCNLADLSYVILRFFEILGTYDTCTIAEQPSATVLIQADSPLTVATGASLWDVIRQMKPAGVRFEFLYGIDSETNTALRCSSGTDIFRPLSRHNGLSLSDITEMTNGDDVYGTLCVVMEA